MGNRARSSGPWLVRVAETQAFGKKSEQPPEKRCIEKPKAGRCFASPAIWTMKNCPGSENAGYCESASCFQCSSLNAFELHHTPVRWRPPLVPLHRWEHPVHWLAQGHGVSKWGSQDSSPHILAPKSHALGLCAAQSLRPGSCSAVRGEGQFLWSRAVLRVLSAGRETRAYLGSLFSTQRSSERLRWTLVLTGLFKELSTECLYLCFHKWKKWAAERVTGFSKFT